MIFFSIFVLIFKSPQSILPAINTAAENAVNLCINFIGIYIIWLGILEILEKTGITEKLAKILNKPIQKLFKTQDKKAIKYICLNLSSNILGLGNVATPSGINAMQSLDIGSTKAIFPMKMLLIINATSLSVIPTTCIGLRLSAKSTNATSIILPTILTSIICLIVAISLALFCEKIFNKRAKKHDK